MIDGVKRAEVLLFSFFSIPIQLQSEAVKAVEAVKHCLARLHTPACTNTHAAKNA